MHVVSVVGARPNFVKIAPISWEMARLRNIRHTVIHTGQHFDREMSESFFKVLEIPKVDINLNVGTGTHGVQTGTIMVRLEPVLEELRPDWVLTVGDVNSTAAAALVAVKLGLRTVHVEAGLRSFDRTMPEEINRLITDAISDLLMVTEQSGLENLAREGVSSDKVRFVGNVMIDSLVRTLPKAREAKAWERFGFTPGEYLLVTLHRPSNVDREEILTELMEALKGMAAQCPLLFPVHPRTKGNLEKFGLFDSLDSSLGVRLTEPLDYFTFISLVTAARALLTDSGGIQEETTYLGIPCLTLRPNTERPVTIELGTNELIPPTKKSLLEAFQRLESGRWKKGKIPPLWDGKTAGRIVNALLQI